MNVRHGLSGYCKQILCILTGLFFILEAIATEREKKGLLRFNIATQSLATALVTFADQAQLQSLLYNDEDLAGKTGLGLKGELTVDAALTQLLTGSGLAFTIIESGIIVIQPAPSSGKKTVPGYAHKIRTSAHPPADNHETEYQNIVEIVTIGTRVKGRTTVEASVPVDVYAGDMLTLSGAGIGAQLQSVSPSFNFSRTMVSDGSDIVRPATLRGMNPDQLLVLINGKRRHHQAQINIQQVVGRGASGTDLNAIPMNAIERIEVLRDGAAAQYGSDAIAGVINIVLKSRPDKTVLGSQIGQTRQGDGDTQKVLLETSVSLGEKGDINLFVESLRRDATNRAGLDSRFDPPRISMKIGDAEIESSTFFFNGHYLLPNAEAYFFGGVSRKKGISAGFYRGAGAESYAASQGVPPELSAVNGLYIPQVYPFGFLPLQTTKVDDHYLSLGIRDHTAPNDSFDISVTYGANRYTHGSQQSINVSLGEQSPLSADSGTLAFRQLSLNMDVNRRLIVPDTDWQWYLAAGFEYRLEQYRVHRGDFASYAYGPQDDYNIFIPSPVDPCPSEPGPQNCSDGSLRSRAQAGMQAYPGFRTQVNKFRDNLAVYFDLETNLHEHLRFGAAGRFGYYDEEGLNGTGKLSMRYQWSPTLALRGAVSTGFRVPGLNQRAFTNVFTNIGPSVLTQTLHAAQGSTAAAALGIDDLQEEHSKHVSWGLVWQPVEDLTLTLDLYRIDIDDRIVLTDVIEANATTCTYEVLCQLAVALESINQNIGAVQLFANGVDSNTKGADFVLNYQNSLGTFGLLEFNSTVHYNKTHISAVHAPGKLSPNLFFSQAQIDLIETGQPRQRLTFGIDWTLGPWRSMLRFNRYGKVKTSYFTEDSLQVDVPGAEDPVHKSSAAWLTDVDISYTFSSGYKVGLGATNVFDVLPDRLRPGNVPAYITGGSFVYPWESTPFGINGAYYYLHLQAVF